MISSPWLAEMNIIVDTTIWTKKTPREVLILMMCIYMYIYIIYTMCVYIHIYIYTYTCTHTYTCGDAVPRCKVGEFPRLCSEPVEIQGEHGTLAVGCKFLSVTWLPSVLTDRLTCFFLVNWLSPQRSLIIQHVTYIYIYIKPST